VTRTYSINIWINEERDQQLRDAGLANLANDALAGMKVLQLNCKEKEKDEILKLYPMAKFDSSTTKSIELLPAEMKNKMFNLTIKRKNVNVIEEFLESVR
jgi:hypothetical protein